MEKGYRIVQRFTVFDVEFYPNCTYDYVRIVENQRTVGTYCGNAGEGHAEAVALKKLVVSSGNRIELFFHSDYSNEEMFKGFEVHYRAAGETTLLPLNSVRITQYHMIGQFAFIIGQFSRFYP